MLFVNGEKHRVSVDDITKEVMARALADFNCKCAERKLGHWPTSVEAIVYFLNTSHGLSDALHAIGAEEYPITTLVPPQVRCPMVHSD